MTKVLLLVLFVGCIQLIFCEVSYVVSRQMSQTGMLKIYRDDRTKEMTECYIFGDQEIIERILAAEDVAATDVNGDQFQKLLKECIPTGRSSVRQRVSRDRAELTRDGQAMRQERMRVNEDIKTMSRAAVEAVEEGRNPNPNENEDGRQQHRDIDLGYEILYAIYPGTLWCGAGNISEFAEDADGLGELKELDAACRTHDHCPISVPGWGSAYGLVNISPITCSECSCDELFLSSLQTINDEHTNLLGDVFFNIVSIDCIRLEHPWVCVDYSFLNIICLEEERDKSAPKEYEFYDGLVYPSQ